MEFIKIRHKVVREVSKYIYSDYMNDFMDGTPEKFKELTGKKVSAKEIKAYHKIKEPDKDKSDVDGSTIK